MPDFSFIVIPLLLCGLLMMLTPLPAIICFCMALDQKTSPGRSTFTRLFQTVPTCIGPVCLLALYAVESEPDWRDQGTAAWPYMTRGDAAWIYFPPYVMANFLVARVVISPDFAEHTWLPRLSFITCILISLLFVAGYNAEPFTRVFPASTAIAYAVGTMVYCRGRPRPGASRWQISLFTAWLTSAVSTVYVSVLQARRMVAELPDTAPPGCFIVTAAARGHRRYVGSDIDPATGHITNRQLIVFRAFEAWLQQNATRLHAILRRLYNRFGPVVARQIRRRWQADLVYTMLKPVEWLLRGLGFAFSLIPGRR